jgi:hypothetical protein
LYGGEGVKTVGPGPTSHVGASNEAFWALASHSVLHDLTEGVIAASGAQAARVAASAVDASLVNGALSVVGTTDFAYIGAWTM